MLTTKGGANATSIKDIETELDMATSENMKLLSMELS